MKNFEFVCIKNNKVIKFYVHNIYIIKIKKNPEILKYNFTLNKIELAASILF